MVWIGRKTKIEKWLLATFLSLPILTNVYADEIFDEILSAIKGDATDAQLVALEEKYEGKIISGEGYVHDVRVAVFTKGVYVYVSTTYEGYATDYDVYITVPEESPYLNIARNLNKGQKISFSGRLVNIFGFDRTISIKGDVKIFTSEDYQLGESKDMYIFRETGTYEDVIIYLKNGNFLRGKIKKQTKNGVWLKILNGKGEVFIRNSEIEKVKKVK